MNNYSDIIGQTVAIYLKYNNQVITGKVKDVFNLAIIRLESETLKLAVISIDDGGWFESDLSDNVYNVNYDMQYMDIPITSITYMCVLKEK